MFGSATFTTVMSSRSMNVVVQTATSVQRRSGARGAGSTAAILGNRLHNDETAQGPFRTRGMGRWVAMNIGAAARRLSPPFE